MTLQCPANFLHFLQSENIGSPDSDPIILVLTEKYQKKLKKVTKLIDIITPALVVFERVVSSALKNGIIDEEEFNKLQTLHLETLNELKGLDRTMEAEHRSLVERSLLEEINNIKKNTGTIGARN